MAAESYQPVFSADEQWILEERRFLPEYIGKYEAIFTQGNGYLGQRAALDEPYVDQTRNLFVSGTFDRFDESEVTELPNLPDVTNIRLFVDGREFSMIGGELERYNRALDLRTGELTRQVCWRSAGGAELNLRWQRVVSLENVHLIASKMTICADRDVSIRIVSGIDGRQTNTGTQHTVEGNERVYDGRILEYPCRTLHSGVQIMMHTAHSLYLDGKALEAKMKIETSRRFLGGSYTLTLKAGQTLCLEKLSMVHTSRDAAYAALSEEASRARVRTESLEQFRACCTGRYDDAAQSSSRVWMKFWEAQDVVINSAHPDDQIAVRFAVYHLNIMKNHADNRTGIAAKGLSGEGYKGHSFWDTETFIFPFFLFTQPRAARMLLEYRYQILDGARKLAHKCGYDGAMYPWESAWIDDGDVTPDNLGVDLVTGELLPCETGQLEHHVTADIAMAVHQYFEATHDMEFMEQCGFEMLLETARFWVSRMSWNEAKKRWEILHVIGPDEYQVDVDNNAYTNYLAAINLQLGLRTLELLRDRPAVRACIGEKVRLTGLEELFQERLADLYLPQPESETGILPQFDGYLQLKQIDLTAYRTAKPVGRILHDYNFEMLRHVQAAKQADVVQLMCICEDLFPEEIRRKNYLYYEPRTLHDSSLSKAIHSILASDLGMADEAYDMFHGATETDLGPEPDSCSAGIHGANMGGIWQAAVMGFGGARVLAGRLRIAPHLPSGWTGLKYCLHWGRNHLRVQVTKTQVCVENAGPALTIETESGEIMLQENAQTVWALHKAPDCKNKPTLKGIIFDLDGVLCSTDEFHYQAWKTIADREGIFFDREINNRLRGVSRMESLEIILERADRTYSQQEKEQMVSEKNEIYRSLLRQMSPEDAAPQTRQALTQLRGRGLKLAVGSSSRNAGLILERTNLREYFDAVSDGNNITHSKPDPEVFLKAAEMLGLRPQECLVVEDAQAGAQAAKNGGFRCAGIGEAAACGLADYALEQVGMLPELLRREKL